MNMSVLLPAEIVIYKEEGDKRSGSTVEPSDAVDNYFCYNPKGDADFAVRVVAALAGRARYLLHTAPSGCQQNPLSQNEHIH